LACEDDSGTIRLFEAATGKERRMLKSSAIQFSQLAFAPNGRLLAGGGSTDDKVQVNVWDVASGGSVQHWDWPKGRDPHSTVESLSFSPNGKWLAAAVFRQSSAYLMDMSTGKRIAELAHGQVYGLSFSPDSETLATAGWDRTVRFWNVPTGKLAKQFSVTNGPRDKGDDLRMYAVCYAPSGGLIATAHMDNSVRVWKADDMTAGETLRTEGFVYGALCFSPDGLWIATGGSGGDVALWDPLTGKKVWDAGRHEHYVYTVGFGRDRRTLLSGGEDGVCYLWDMSPPQKVADNDWNQLWSELAGDNGAAAYAAICQLSASPRRAVELVAEKLRQVTSVVDSDFVPRNSLITDNRSRPADAPPGQNAGVEKSVTVRRALSVVAEIGSPAAIGLLRELANQRPLTDVGRLASVELDRLQMLEETALPKSKIGR
jgi:WD40 repeat protein